MPTVTPNVRLQMLRLIAKRLGYKLKNGYPGITRYEQRRAWELLNYERVLRMNRERKRRYKAAKKALTNTLVEKQANKAASRGRKKD